MYSKQLQESTEIVSRGSGKVTLWEKNIAIFLNNSVVFYRVKIIEYALKTSRKKRKLYS